MSTVRRQPLAFVLCVLCGCATTRNDRHIMEQQRLETSIAARDAEVAKLRAELDSLVAQNDSLRRTAARLEGDVLDREEQIRAIRLELQRLKEIDLKPRSPKP
jgi:cell division protein FtsB